MPRRGTVVVLRPGRRSWSSAWSSMACSRGRISSAAATCSTRRACRPSSSSRSWRAARGRWGCTAGATVRGDGGGGADPRPPRPRIGSRGCPTSACVEPDAADRVHRVTVHRSTGTSSASRRCRAASDRRAAGRGRPARDLPHVTRLQVVGDRAWSSGARRPVDGDWPTSTHCSALPMSRGRVDTSFGDRRDRRRRHSARWDSRVSTDPRGASPAEAPMQPRTA
jgi:hypothetical protein